MRKIKVLRIISRLNIGGPAIHAVLLTQGLNRDLFESLLVTGSVSKGESDMLYLAEEKRVKPFIVPELGRDISLKNDFTAFFKLYSLIKRIKPDIIHTHTAKAGFLGRLAGILAGVPLKIHTFHGHVFHGYFSRLKSAIFILAERLLGYYTNKIIAVSDTIKKELLHYKIANSDKVITVPLGLELDKLLSLEQKNENGEFKIGIVGRLTGIKNHKLFLQVAKEFVYKNKNNKGYQVKFVVIGDGELKNELIDYVGSLGIGNVEFKGWIKDVRDIYRNLDIVLLTSLNEGTPVSLIEAMAAAKPVIATDVGGVRDLLLPICDKLGIPAEHILTQSNNAKQIIDNLSLLLQDKELRTNFGQAGREFVKNSFTKERLIKDMEKLYTECFLRSEK